MDIAYRLIDKAAEAGADIVKFQTFKAERLASIKARKAEYQFETTDARESQVQMLKKLELAHEHHQKLIDRCRQNSIKFLSAPFDLVSLDFLADLGLDTIKIPSGEITNLPYLKKVGQLNKNVILSTGMSYMEEVEAAVDVIASMGTNRNKIALLHCNTEYPTPYNDVNLKAMKEMGERLGLVVGYSDHTLGIEIPVAAVALGAAIIEKHFTLDKSMEGPDHRASLEPDELKAMIKAIRNIEVALGRGEKVPSPSEMKNRAIVRKSIVASRDMKKGEVFTDSNITVKRPGTGINPMMWDDIIGSEAQKDYTADELIDLQKVW